MICCAVFEYVSEATSVGCLLISLNHNIITHNTKDSTYLCEKIRFRTDVHNVNIRQKDMLFITRVKAAQNSVPVVGCSVIRRAIRTFANWTRLAVLSWARTGAGIFGSGSFRRHDVRLTRCCS